MHSYPECFICLSEQALKSARIAGADEAQQHVVLQRVHKLLQNTNPILSPSDIGEYTSRIVYEVTGVNDQYHAIKAENTRQALALYPRLKNLVEEAADPLDVALRLAIGGNIIDTVHNTGNDFEYDLEAVIQRMLVQPYAGDGLETFREAFTGVKSLLYLGDNAGETVFDRVLIETLDVPTTYVVKAGPVINDTTYEDAVAAGLDKVAQIISNGVVSPGTVLSRASEEFLNHFRQAEFIISKGQANFETLDDVPFNGFFLLQIKCAVLGEHAGLPQGGMVLKQAMKPVK